MSWLAVLVLSLQTAPQPARLDLPVHLVNRVFSGEPHTYRLTLHRGHSLIGRVEQKGVDLVVRVRDGRGAVVFEVDSPNGADGPEPVAWIAPADGDYHLEIHPFEAASDGAYDLVIERSRAATKRDRELVEALSSYLLAFRQRGEALGLQGQGEFARSNALYLSAKRGAEKALRMRSRQFGTGAVELAPIHQLLGLIDDEIGEYRSGVRHFAKALEILEAAYGQDHPGTITTRSDLGHLRLAAGDYAGAAAIFESVLAHRDRTGDQARAANALVALGDTLARDQQLEPAEAALRRAVHIRTSTLGPDHPSTDNARVSLGTILARRGAVDEAETICRRVDGRLTGATGGSHHRAAVNGCLAETARHKRDFAEATERAESMVRILEAAYGPNGPPTAEGLALLGSVYLAAGHALKARESLDRAVRIQEQRLGAEHPSTVRTRQALAGLTRR